MANTPAQWVTIYETAIEGLVSGLQSYTIPNRGTFTRADLATLHRILNYWRGQDARASYGSVTLADANRAGQSG